MPTAARLNYLSRLTDTAPEFLPGEYVGQCWNEQSVFLAEDVFGLIEPIIARHEPNFDHYAFVTIPRPNWVRIIEDLEQLPGKVPDDADPQAVAAMSAELVAWLRMQLSHIECVSVLGM